MYKNILSAIILFTLSFYLHANSHYEAALKSFKNNEFDSAYVHLRNELAGNPDNISAHILIGRVLLKKGRIKDAIIAFQDAISLGADSNPFIYELARSALFIQDFQEVIKLSKNPNLNTINKIQLNLLASNAYNEIEQPDQALSALKKAEQIDSNKLSTITSLAHHYLKQRNFYESKIYLDKALSIAPENNRIWQLKGEYLNAQGQGDKALEAFKTAYQLAPEDPVIMRSLANQFYLLNQLDQALTFIDKILAKTPYDTYAELLKSRLLIQNGQSEQANQILQGISSKLSLVTDGHKHENPNIAFVAGSAAYLLGNFEQAQQELIYYVNTKPEDLSGINMLVEIYQYQNKQSKIEGLLERYEPRIKKDIHLALNLFNIYLNNKKTYKAKSLLNELERLYQNNALLIIAKSNYLASVNRLNEAIALLEKNSPSPIDSRFELTKAKLYLTSNQINKANTITEKLLSITPHNSQLLIFKGLLLSKQQQWQQAINHFDQVLKNTPSHFAASYNKATSLASLKEFEQAIKIIEKLVKIYSDNNEVKILQAKLYRDTEQLEKAELILNQVLLLKPRDLSASKVLFDVYMRSEQFDKALQEAERLNSNSFLNPEYIANKAEVLIKLKKFELANKQIGKLKGLAKTQNHHYLISKLQTASHSYSSAVDSLNSALKLAPDNFVYQIEKAKLLLILNEDKQSLALLNKLKATHKNNPNLSYALGLYYLKKNQLPDSYQAFSHAFSLDNTFIGSTVKMYQLAQKGIKQKDFISSLESTLAKNKQLSFVRNLLADFYLTQQQPEKALHHYLIMLDQPSFSHSSIYNNLANIYAKKDIEKALSYIEKAIALNNQSPDFLDTYGWVLAQKGDFSLSLNKLRQASAIKPDDPTINYHLGFTLAKLGRTEDAVNALSKALSTAATFTDKANAQELFNQLTEQ